MKIVITLQKKSIAMTIYLCCRFRE